MYEEEALFLKFRKITYPGIDPNRYFISQKGDVYDSLNERFITLAKDKDGYFLCKLNNKTYRINRLVAWEYCFKNRDLSLVVDHVDGNKQNNWYWNLEWVTVKENTRRAELLGLRNVRGENSSTNIYSEQFVHDICNLLIKGKTNIEIFKSITGKDRADLSIAKDKSLYMLIYRLRNKEIWPDVTSQYPDFPKLKSDKLFKPIDGNNRFSESNIHEICKMLKDGKSVIDIAERFGCYKGDDDYRRITDQIRAIKNGRNWTYISKQYFDHFEVQSRNSTYDIDIEKLCDLVSKGYTRDQIFHEFGIERCYENRLIIKAMNRRINTIMKNNKIEKNKDISLEDLK